MTPLAKKFLIILTWMAILAGIGGCQTAATPTPTPTATSTMTHTPTITPTSTVTQTSTPAFTITQLPSNTSTITPTPYRTLSPTSSHTQVQLRPAVLFPFKDINGRTVDWSYSHVTEIGTNRLDEVNHLWAFIAFQIMDRAIHQRNLVFLGETITVYYLNVAHEFNGVMTPMQLVLGGTPGENVPIKDIPAGGNAYIQVQIRELTETFDPYITHRDANRAYELRDETYPLLVLKELQEILPAFPNEIILLADHPILFPPDEWPQIKLDMRRVSYLCARYDPFFSVDSYGRLADQSDFAYALKDYLLYNYNMPAGLYAYSSQTLIIITGE